MSPNGGILVRFLLRLSSPAPPVIPSPKMSHGHMGRIRSNSRICRAVGKEMKSKYTKTQLPEINSAISDRARELWLRRGSPTGEDVAIWLEAEREILAKYSGTGTSTSPQPGVKLKDKLTASDINDELQQFGDADHRSATSVDLT